MDYKYTSSNYFNPSINLMKILFTHKYLARTNPGYLRPTINSIAKRSYKYKENHTLLHMTQLFNDETHIYKNISRYYRRL